MLEGGELARGCQPAQWCLLQGTLRPGVEILPKPACIEDEEAAVDEALRRLRLLVELPHEPVVDADLTKAAGRTHRRDGGDFAVGTVEGDQLMKIEVGHAVTVGQTKQFVLLDVTTHGRQAAAGLCAEPRFSKRHAPVFFSRPIVDVDRRTRAEVDGDIRRHGAVVEKEFLDEPAFVTQTKHKVSDPAGCVGLHDVPHDRLVSDRQHRLGQQLTDIADPAALSATQNDCLHATTALVRPPGPMCKYARPAASVNNNQKQPETRDRKPGTFFLQFAIFDHVPVWGPGIQGAYAGGHANWFAAAAGGVLISLAVMAEVTKPVSVQATSGRLDPATEARAQVLETARRFFALAHAPQPFVAGRTYIPVTAKQLSVEDLVHLLDASLDLWLTSGRYGRALESALASAMQRQCALLVNSGSSANLVAISALSSALVRDAKYRPLEKGDEVITAAAGFPTTVNPIVQNGWIPVFVDVDFRTLNVSPEAVMAARSPRTRAVVLAHTLGNPYRADILGRWCRDEGLFLVEDCCDAFGATISAVGNAGHAPAPVGSFGDFATLSFYPAHHITTGEGGAVIPRDARLKRVAESLRDWGRDCWCDTGKENTCGKRFGWSFDQLPPGYDHKYVYSSIGYNLKMTDMQAAIGLSQLQKLDGFIAARRQNWRTLYDGVKHSPVLAKYLIPVEPTPGTDPSWFGFPLHCAEGLDRQRLVVFLEEHQVGTRLLFGSNLTKQPAYKNIEFRVYGNLSASDEVLRRTFWIGVHPGLDRPRLTYMLEQLEAGVRAQRT